MSGRIDKNLGSSADLAFQNGGAVNFLNSEQRGCGKHMLFGIMTGNPIRSGEPEDLWDVAESEIINSKRLGFGALTHPQTDRWIARMVLLRRMRARCPTDITEIETVCLPLYESLFHLGMKLLPTLSGDQPHLPIETKVSQKQLCRSVLWVDSWKALEIAGSQYEIAKELKKNIAGWAEPRHLAVEWFLDVIVQHLCAWRVLPKNSPQRRFSMPGIMQRGSRLRFAGDSSDFHRAVKGLGAAVPPLTIPSYNPAMQTPQEHLELALEKLHLHHKEQEQLFRTAAFVDSKLVRARKADAWEHTDWFISYQIGGLTAAQVALSSRHADSVTEAGVRNEIKKVAILLDIPLRPSDYGKSKNT